MLLQHGFHSVQDGTDHFTEQFVLVPEIIIYVPHTDTDGSGNLAHGGLGIPLLPESLFGDCQYAAAYVFFEYLHK